MMTRWLYTPLCPVKRERMFLPKGLPASFQRSGRISLACENDYADYKSRLHRNVIASPLTCHCEAKPKQSLFIVRGRLRRSNPDRDCRGRPPLADSLAMTTKLSSV